MADTLADSLLNRLLKDAELFDARLGKIGGFADIGRALVEQVKAKSIQDSSGDNKTAQSSATSEDPSKKKG